MHGFVCLFVCFSTVCSCRIYVIGKPWAPCGVILHPRIKGKYVGGGLVRAVHLRNMDEIILKQLIYLGITKELAGDSFVLWQGQ